MLVVHVLTFEEGGPNLENDDYNPLSVDVLGVERAEEDELTLALKASFDTTLEEKAARGTSIFFDDVPGIFSFFFNSFSIIFPVSI